MNSKEELYNDICEALTAYEHRDNDDIDWHMDDKDWIRNFYCLLVKIQNNWEEITGE